MIRNDGWVGGIRAGVLASTVQCRCEKQYHDASGESSLAAIIIWGFPFMLDFEGTMKARHPVDPAVFLAGQERALRVVPHRNCM